MNHVYGTGAALPALEACGFDARPSGDPQGRGTGSTPSSTSSGGFGEDIRSLPRADHARPRRRHRFTNGVGVTRLRRGRRGTESVGPESRRLPLREHRLENGDWHEEHYTGTGFPTDFMIRYHLYRLHFPLMALGRLRERLNG